MRGDPKNNRTKLAVHVALVVRTSPTTWVLSNSFESECQAVSRETVVASACDKFFDFDFLKRIIFENSVRC